MNFLQKIKNLSDEELLKLARDLFAYENSEGDFLSRRIDRVFEECHNRKLDIFSNLNHNDIFNPKIIKGLAKAVDIRFFDNLTRKELEEFEKKFPKSKFSEFACYCGIGDKNVFIGKVSGNSMIEAKLYDGDYFICETEFVLRDGDIIIVEIEGVLFVKRYKIINGEKYLVSENPNYPNYKLSAFENYSFKGKVRKTIRDIE